MSSCGNTDFAITLHPAQQAYVSKTEGYTSDSVASEFPAGSDEMIQVYIETAGYYAISIWKVDQAYLPEVGRAYAEGTPVGSPRRSRTR